MKACTYIVMFYFFHFSAYSQAAPDEYKAMPSIRARVASPHPISNRAFVKSMNGIYDISINAGVNVIKKKFFVGGVFKVSMFTNDSSFRFNSTSTELQTFYSGMIIGYDWIISEKNMFSPSISAGHNWNKGIAVKSSNPRKDYNFESNHIEISSAYTMFVQKNLGFSIDMSYILFFNEFDPYFLALHENGFSFSPGDVRGNTSYLNIGFGFYYRLMKESPGKGWEE